MTETVRIKIRRDTASNWASANPILLDGELGLDKTSGLMKIGDEVTPWNTLPFFEPQIYVEDIHVNGAPEGSSLFVQDSEYVSAIPVVGGPVGNVGSAGVSIPRVLTGTETQYEDTLFPIGTIRFVTDYPSNRLGIATTDGIAVDEFSVIMMQGDPVPLNYLTGYGATFGQVPVWNGTAWEPGTVSGGGGLELDPGDPLLVYGDFTDESNYTRIALVPSPASGWVQLAAQTAGTGTDNIGVAITPVGSGALAVNVPDSTATGGNARGTYSVDLQRIRSVATQVCGGTYSGLLSGFSNTIATSAAYSVLGGGSNNSRSNSYYGVLAGGYQNAVSANNATVSGGGSNTASGTDSWIPGGQQATTRGLKGSYAYSAGRRSANGDAQVIGQPVRRTTTDATPVTLATDGTPAASTVMVLPANSSLVVSALVVARDSSGNTAGWRAEALFKRDGSNNTTRLGSATVTAIGTPDSALSAATIDLVANDTRESAEIEVTGIAGTTIHWVGELKCVQVA